ncbi:(d)CMP kinase [Cetobacterium sp. 8H]|uniref:(d)CMP kinase n=1 Tax=Cetobacterium sp. 8H TaxID=2759681 RepID=UPI00163C1052|nr:(d)CMP kinase [Cetobacterium sp. 8H]MBC2850542.1 (d)CMP kinase [Cetobacterium sp. 8H]
MKNYIVALDGPAGSGKSTIAKIVAKEFELTYLDTGAMYRMVALYVLENSIDYTDEIAVENALKNIHMNIIGEQFFLNGEDVSLKIRTPEVTKIVSPVSAIKAVRVKLVDLQREISKGKNVILDGRDIGTVVFPNADLKVFLIASAEERAKRRVNDYQSKGINEDFNTVLKGILERDHTDSTRKESPLKKANDAIEVDTSFLNIQESSKAISDLIKEKIGG